MTIEAQVQQILANQATIITNQATILAAVQAGSGETDAAALAAIAAQVTDIQSQLETPPVSTPPSSGTTGTASS